MRKHKKCSSIKASSGHATTIENLPNEVLSDIFIQLLAKQLAQMRCMCKSWNALISDSSFIKSHLHRSIQNNDEVFLFSSLMFSFDIGPSPFGAHKLSCTPNMELTNFIKPPLVAQDNIGCGVLIGSVHGLICFSYASSVDNYVLHIWNPSLSALLSLPPCPLRSCGRVELGFGYDPKSDDYKIVKLTTSSGAPNIVAKGEVYSMRKGSWKLITQSFPSLVTVHRDYNYQVCVDGHLHWLCNSNLEENPQMIVAFDLDVETFNEMPLPVVYKVLNVLGVLGGRLCVMSWVTDGGCEVWVMKEYGVADSWVKHHAFSQFHYIIPYGFTSNGEFLFQTDQVVRRSGLYELPLGLYDPIAAKTKTFKMMLHSSESKVVEYVDSLVWVAPPSRKSDNVSLV